ncbi:MAG: dihydropteroate synthase [Rhodospirillaceae bacterium]|nr:dihydropteroate synthase [Rhodospirillaceae bacterium]MBT3909434.1 dihydropteroate synthase [Rhodospirillaceae bacterium]MBT5298911.1 dihydropteroate synthase [Rhodospirillaceae bacterium]MBT5514956.1 dihydropteroate synthase [Rhodospirillaceae bacterium]MBT6086887.1 dihydropteroate synthase [Rhodospirillaceae bacterium]
MKLENGGLIVIGENFNSTRKIKATSPRVTEEDGKTGIKYTDLDGNDRILDCTDIIPEDPAERNSFMIPHIAQALRQKDMNYIAWAIKNQEKHGAHIIDLCVDEMSVYPEERFEWIKWIVETAQKITDSIVAIDSSDSNTIYAGLEAHDGKKNRPAINSFNLEDGRQELVPMAREHNALLFANASGNAGMPADDVERVENLATCMEMMDAENIPMEDRFLDPLVFPIGAGPEFGNHYLDAVRQLRENYPEVHLFGGHSNVSFGLPQRKGVNDTFVSLAILAGCDSIMVDPVMNPPADLEAFMFAANALTGKDEYSMQYLKYTRAKMGVTRRK